jgi:hypothetical protein
VPDLLTFFLVHLTVARKSEHFMLKEISNLLPTLL